MHVNNSRSAVSADPFKEESQHQKPFELLIFDFDGVLVDTQGIVNKIQYEYIKEKFGLNMELAHYAERFSGMRVETIVGILEQEKNFNFSQSPNEISRHIDEIVLKELSNQEISPLPGVVHFLQSSSLKRCIGSNCTFRLLKAFLQSSHLLDFFDGNIFSADMVAHPKPAPDLFLYAADKMGQNPKDCLVIEDSLAGVQAAVKAGIQVVGFLAGSHIASKNSSCLLQAGSKAILNDMRHLDSYLSLARQPA